MRDPQTKTIGNHSYTVAPLDAVEGSRMLTRIAKIVSPALEAVESPDLAKLNFGKLAALVLKGIEEKDVDYLRDKFAAMTQLQLQDGRTVRLTEVLGAHFAGEFGAMFEWMKFALEVNFGDFFTVLRAKKVPAAALVSSTTST